MSHGDHNAQAHATDSAPGDDMEHGGENHSVLGYLVGLGLAVLLTGMSFFISQTSLVWTPSLPIALAVLAVAQMGVHIVFFLHIGSGPDNVNNIMALALGVLIVFLVITGSLWIMYHLNHNMLPMDQIMDMQR